MIQEHLQSILKKLPSGVTLVAVSKFHPVSAIQEAYVAGQRVFAESRPQELSAKVPLLPKDIQWHFIGHLQTNKLKMVLPFVSLVQSVDSFHLLEAISAWAVANNKVVDVLLELHLGAEETKHGFTEEEMLSIVSGADTPPVTHGHPRPCKREGPAGCWDGEQARLVAGTSDGGRGLSEAKEVSGGVSAPLKGIRIRGLMGMATNTDDMAVVERDFERIEGLFRKIQAMGLPGFDQLSIGMSGDWPMAVKHGATMVRIGTDIFGQREY